MYRQFCSPVLDLEAVRSERSAHTVRNVLPAIHEIRHLSVTQPVRSRRVGTWVKLMLHAGLQCTHVALLLYQASASCSHCVKGCVQASVCWGDEQSNTLISLTQVLSGPMAGKPVDRGSASYVQVACSTRDVYKCASNTAEH